MNNKHIVAILAGSAIIAVACNWTLFLTKPAYARHVIGINLPEPVESLTTYRIGSSSPRIECQMDFPTFTSFKTQLSENGYADWSESAFTPEKNVPLISAITVAGTKSGLGSTLYHGKKRAAKSSVHVYFDYSSRTFIAINGY